MIDALKEEEIVRKVGGRFKLSTLIQKRLVALNAGARPLLLLHASGCHAHWWDEVGPALADIYDVIALNLRGHGDSSHPEPSDYRFEAYVADIAALVAALGWRDFDLVGHSMGGYIALSYASTQPPALRAQTAPEHRETC